MFSKKDTLLIFFIIMAGLSMTFMDQTILPVALPAIQRDLSVDSGLLYWIMNGYYFSAAVLFIAGGKVSDAIGHKKGFLYGTLFFGFASLLCGLAEDGVFLCVTRFLQGAGVALVVPSATSLVLEIFPPSSKGKVMGMLMGGASLFLLLGPFLGGIITQYISWRYIFFVNIPLTLLAAFGAWRSIPHTEGHPHPLDIPGFMLLILSLLSVIYPIMQVSLWGWSSVKFWVLLLAACVFIGLLYTISRRDEHPFVEADLFKNQKFSGAVLIAFFTRFALALAIFWPIFFQKILSFSPAATGAINLLAILPVLIFAPLTGKLADTYGSYTPAKYGFLSLGFCLVWSIFAFPSRNVYLIVFGMVFLGIGVTMISSSTGIFGLGEVDGRKKGVASGMYSTARYLGLSIGIAVVSTIIATFQKLLFAVNMQYHSDTANLDVAKILTLYDGNEATRTYVDSLPANAQEHIRESLYSATAYAYSIGTLVVLGVLIFGFAILYHFFKTPSKSTHHNPEIDTSL